jgi:DNA polymerase-4
MVARIKRMSNSFQEKNTAKSAVLHIDGDAFFASCEIAQNEAYRGKPVVAGADRGIALAVSYEAKKRGISRGMLIGECRKICPEVIVSMLHYDTYSIYAKRMYAIARRYVPIIEEYSIDECFGDLSPLSVASQGSFQGGDEGVVQVARNIKHDLERDLGMTFSIGVAPTKVLAKVASKWNKPAGFTVLTHEDIPLFLEKIPVGKIWGIGPSGSAHLMKHNVRTALELAQKPEWWVKEHLAKPYLEIWYELNGRQILRVNDRPRPLQKSIMKTGTFKPVTKDQKILLAELARNTERACRKLRNYHCITHDVYFYLKTQKFTYRSTDFRLPLGTNNPMDIMDEIEKHFPKIYSNYYDYRATGVIFRTISPATTFQPDLFGNTLKVEDRGVLFETIDRLTHKFGKQSLQLARSLLAPRTKSRKERLKNRKLYSGLILGIPSWGEVI